MSDEEIRKEIKFLEELENVHASAAEAELVDRFRYYKIRILKQVLGEDG